MHAEPSVSVSCSLRGFFLSIKTPTFANTICVCAKTGCTGDSGFPFEVPEIGFMFFQMRKECSHLKNVNHESKEAAL